MALTIIACVHPTACAVGYDLALHRSFATDTNLLPNKNRFLPRVRFDALNGAPKNINPPRPGLALLKK